MVDFLIIGAQKAGTTAAKVNLGLHPKIRMFNGINEYGQRELEFFNQHWDRGESWYAQYFPSNVGLNGEKTAELLHRKVCHKRMWETVPEAKLIVLLRNPIERAYSQWKMAKYSKKDEPRSFDEVVEAEWGTWLDEDYLARFGNCEEKGSTWKQGYIVKGMYMDQLRSLESWFPHNQIYIGISERIRRDMTSEYGKMLEFLGLEPYSGEYTEQFVGKNTEPMTNETREKLKAIYAKPNQELYHWLNEEIAEWT